MERNLINPTLTNWTIVIMGYFSSTTSKFYKTFFYYPELEVENKSTQDLADEPGESIYFNG